MDWYPLYNSLRIALISSVIVFFSGIFTAYYIAKLYPVLKGILDVVLRSEERRVGKECRL